MTEMPDTSEPKSRLGIAFALSMVAIFSTYFVSSFDTQKEYAQYEHTHSQRPILVSAYLA